jgi:hypothetical protein
MLFHTKRIPELAKSNVKLNIQDKDEENSKKILSYRLYTINSLGNDVLQQIANE